ncbi:MAG: NTP transferase domain-containing protein [Verrucomicrobiota bacterium]
MSESAPPARPQFYAVIPAAGHARRMVGNKLGIPWRNGCTVLENVLTAWRESCVKKWIVVIRAEDARTAEVCRSQGAEVCLLPSETPDMKATVQAGLHWLEQEHAPGEEDFCFIAPADLPRLGEALINTVAAAAMPGRLIAPLFGDRHGHPLCLSWQLVPLVHALERDEGLDTLFRRCEVHAVAMPAEARVRDMDTRAEYLRELGLPDNERPESSVHGS